MIPVFFALCLLLLTPGADAAAAPLSLTLPSADTYCYWVQSAGGPVKVLPVMVAHKKSVPITGSVTTGDHLLVLDAHTGEIASRKISIGLSGAPLPITLALTDFQPVSAPVSVSPAPPAAAQSKAPPPPSGGGIARLLTGLFSLLLAGAVGWLVLHLIRTRGEPLRLLARRLGVEVADPAALTAEEEARPADPPVYAAPKRAPEAVPEEAGLRPRDTGAAFPALGRGPSLALSDVPALQGLQGLATGITFALTSGDLTIGRDGDNEIVLAENTVSRRHARLLRDSQGQFTLTDLGSANGVYINGERVQRAILSSGDEVKIGDNYFCFHAGS